MAISPRLHLFEWENLSWFPAFLRDNMTDFLEFIARIAKMYRPLPNFLSKHLEETEKSEILDLGSGAGGPWNQLLPPMLGMNPELKVTLSDYYPNLKAFENMSDKYGDALTFIPSPVDARDVEMKRTSFRTQFLSLHHFKPKDCEAIFRNAVMSRAPIAIIEGQSRNLPSLIGMFFSPINVLLMTPFIRPFRWDRLLFTYLIPILPILILWDGIVSVLRTYTPKELHQMARTADPENQFEWTFEKFKGTPATAFIGRPRS